MVEYKKCFYPYRHTRLEMKRFDGKRWIAAGLTGMMAAAMSITSFAENGWTRVSSRSAWDETYYRSDGQRVTVTDTDQDYVYVYISFTMDGEPTVAALKFTDETRIKAETRILFCWLLRMRL